MLEEFANHVNSYDRNDANIERKYYHSLRVKSLCQLIAKYAGFNDEDANIAEVVGLLHDYSRFEQWNKYKTFKDHKSFDHGDRAVELLFKANKIKKYWNKKEDYDEIYDAIKYHNKLEIPNNLSSHNKLLCKIVRDADKLDIFYLYAVQALKFPEEDAEITPKVKETFYKERSISKLDEQNENDHGLLILALVYDLNFKYSFDQEETYKNLQKSQ